MLTAVMDAVRGRDGRMKKNASIVVVFLAAACLCFSQEWNEKDLIGREVYKVSLDGQSAKTIAEKLGDLYVAYSFSGVSFRDASGKFLNGFDEAYIFAVKGSSVCVLGRIDRQAVSDANGKVLFDVKKSDPKLFPHVAGVSSSILKKPLQPALIGQSIEDPEKYYETPALCALAIDVAKKTLVLAKAK
jgi:hypothetical protein